jgi:myosin heavy subunit
MCIFGCSYRSVLPTDAIRGRQLRQVVEDVLQQQGHQYECDYQLGINRVFLKDRLAQHLEASLLIISNQAAIQIQKYIRCWIERRRFINRKRAAVVLQASVRGWRARYY